MHVRAVEQRIALGNHGDHFSLIEPRGDRGGGRLVELIDSVTIGVVVFCDLGGHGIVERQLLDTGSQMTGNDRPRIAAVAGFGEMGHHVGGAERAHGLQGQELGISRSDADTDELAGHRPGLASALTAAAMALPPMRPRTTRKGTPRELAASASFDSAAPTKPTGIPRIADGFGTPASSSSSRRNKAVGALPIATTAPARRSAQSSSAAAERVVPILSASTGTRGSRNVHTTSLRAGSRARVIPCATISASQRIGAPLVSAFRAAATRPSPNMICRAASTWPHAWIMRTTIPASSEEKRERSASERMIANERS